VSETCATAAALPVSMRASVLSGASSISVEQRPIPAVQSDEVLVRVAAVGVCGSDVHYYREGRIGDFVVEGPLVLGHEVSGRIAAVGAGVDPGRIGQRVAIEPQRPCRVCWQCKSGRYNLCPEVAFYATPPVDGGMSEYAVIRADFAHLLPDHASYELGALCEPVSVGIHCCALTSVRPADTVVVMGAGPIGLLAVVAARQRGAGQVIASDIFPKRLEIARELGAIPVDVRSESIGGVIEERTGGRGADKLFDTSGVRSVIEAAPNLMRKGGAIAVVGLPADDSVTYHMLEVVDKELSIHGVFRYANTYASAVALVSSGQYPVEAVITDRVPLDEALAGFERTLTEKDSTIKVMIEI